MDQALIQLVARLKVRLRRDRQLSLNTQRFFEDTAYAHEMLDAAEDCDDEELVALCMQLRDRLGWISAPPSNPTLVEAAPAPQPVARSAGTVRDYMRGARSW